MGCQMPEKRNGSTLDIRDPVYRRVMDSHATAATLRICWMTLSAVVDQVMSAIHGRGWSRDRGPADCGILPEEDVGENENCAA